MPAGHQIGPLPSSSTLQTSAGASGPGTMNVPEAGDHTQAGAVAEVSCRPRALRIIESATMPWQGRSTTKCATPNVARFEML